MEDNPGTTAIVGVEPLWTEEYLVQCYVKNKLFLQTTVECLKKEGIDITAPQLKKIVDKPEYQGYIDSFYHDGLQQLLMYTMEQVNPNNQNRDPVTIKAMDMVPTLIELLKPKKEQMEEKVIIDQNKQMEDNDICLKEIAGALKNDT